MNETIKKSKKIFFVIAIIIFFIVMIIIASLPYDITFSSIWSSIISGLISGGITFWAMCFIHKKEVANQREQVYFRSYSDDMLIIEKDLLKLSRMLFELPFAFGGYHCQDIYNYFKFSSEVLDKLYYYVQKEKFENKNELGKIYNFLFYSNCIKYFNNEGYFSLDISKEKVDIIEAKLINEAKKELDNKDFEKYNKFQEPTIKQSEIQKTTNTLCYMTQYLGLNIKKYIKYKCPDLEVN